MFSHLILCTHCKSTKKWGNKCSTGQRCIHNKWVIYYECTWRNPHFIFTKFEIFMLFVDLPHSLTCNLELYLVKHVIPFLVPFKSLWENQPYGVDDYLNSTMVRSKEYFTCPHLWSSVKQKSSGCHLAVIYQSSAFIWSSGCHLSVIWPSSSNSLFKTVWTVGIPT